MADALSIASSTATWAAIGAAVGGLAGLVALVTAFINNRTARVSWRTASAAATSSTEVVTPRALLPARSYFVNRIDELRDALLRLDGGEAVVAIEGGVGVGKSATAAELAHRLHSGEPGSARSPDLRAHTFLWIDGQNGCPSLRDICRDLSLLTGDQSLTAVADDQKLTALRVHLAARKTVLLLDNLKLADEPHAQPLRELVATVPNGSFVIASLNRPAALAGARVRLSDLDADHVLELVRHQVGRMGLEGAGPFDHAFAQRLHAVVGGNPRMIEWFLRAFGQSADSLDERLTAVERGADLPEMFAPVFDELTPDARMVLTACATLRGQASGEQLRIACGDSVDTDRALRELADSALLAPVHTSHRPTVYTCAHALRRFVLATAPDAQSARFVERLAQHYTAFFGERWEDARTAIPHMAAIGTVLDELFVRGDDAALQPLFAVVLDIQFTLGLFDDRIRCGAIAHESAVRAGDHAAASLASAVLSSTHAIRDEIGPAREALALGLLAAERSGANAERARQMRCTGFVAYRAGDAEQALAAIEGAEPLARSAGDLNNLVDVLGLRAAAHWYAGRFAASASAARECLAVCEEIPWERASAYPLRDLAEVALQRGLSDEAEALLDRAEAVATEYEDTRQLARVDLTRARMHLLGRRPRAARRVAQRAEAVARSLGLRAEAREARALRAAATRAWLLPPLRVFYAWRRPHRFSDAPVGGD